MPLFQLAQPAFEDECSVLPVELRLSDSIGLDADRPSRVTQPEFNWELGKGYAGSYAELLVRYEFTQLTKRLGSTIQLMKLQA